jgi:multiple sugar transport system substrate-binding protein
MIRKSHVEPKALALTPGATWSRRDILRASAVFGGAISLQAVLSACGSGRRSTNGNDISFITGETETATVKIVRGQIASFEASSGATISPEFVGVDKVVTRLEQLIGAGEPPDVVKEDDSTFARLAVHGQLEPVTDVVKQMGTVPDSSRLIINGEDYIVPTDLSIWLNFYRTDVLENAGVSEPPRTWPEYVAALEAMNGGQVTPNLLVTNAQSSYAGNDVLNSLVSNGGTPWNWDGSSWKVALDQSDNAARAVEALNFFKTRAKYSTPGGSYDYPDVNQAFASGKIAMVQYVGARTLAYLRQQAPDIAKVTDASVVPYAKQLSSQLHSGGYAILRKEGRDPQRAKDLVLSMVRGQGYLDYLWSVPGHLIPPQDELRTGKWLENEYLARDPRLVAAIDETLKSAFNPLHSPGVPQPNITAGEAVNAGIYSEMVAKVVVTGEDAQAAVSAAADKLRKLQQQTEG